MPTPGPTHAHVLRRLIEAAAEAVQGPQEPASPYEAARRALRHAGFALQELGDDGEHARAAIDLKLAADYADRITESCAAVAVPAFDIETAVTVHAVAKLVDSRVRASFPPRNSAAGERIAQGLLRLSLGLQGWGVHDVEQMADNAVAASNFFAQAADLVTK
jgi:hypothetical protein